METFKVFGTLFGVLLIAINYYFISVQEKTALGVLLLLYFICRTIYIIYYILILNKNIIYENNSDFQTIWMKKLLGVYFFIPEWDLFLYPALQDFRKGLRIAIEQNNRGPYKRKSKDELLIAYVVRYVKSKTKKFTNGKKNK